VTYKHRSTFRQTGVYRLFLCCLVTVAVMYAYELLPAKRLLIVPSKDIPHYIYADNNSVGKSMVAWTDFDGLGWECNIENDGKPHVCGSNLYIGGGQGTEGLDLSSYKTINVDMDYSGNDKRLRFYIRNYVPGFSDINDQQTAQFINVFIPIEYIKDDLVLSMSEFTVADWWISESKTPRDKSLPNFQHVVAFGVDISYENVPGKHNLKLNKLEFVGEWVARDKWYLGILVFWLSFIMIAGAASLVRLAREKAKYKKLSTIDPLTGLLNRNGLDEYIGQYFPMDVERRVSMVVMDIDHFKKINDSLGHDGGDVVLKQVSELIKANIRQSDQASRWGGEEFVLVLPDTRLEDAFVIAEKMRALIANASYEQFPDLRVTISLGVGASDGKIPFDQLFTQVDTALYEAKAQGRNRTIKAGV